MSTESKSFARMTHWACFWSDYEAYVLEVFPQSISQPMAEESGRARNLYFRLIGQGYFTQQDIRRAAQRVERLPRVLHPFAEPMVALGLVASIQIRRIMS